MISIFSLSKRRSSWRINKTLFLNLNRNSIDELLDKEILSGSREGAITPTFRKLQTSGKDATLAGGLDNIALGSLSVVNGGQRNQALRTSSVVGGDLDNLSKGTHCIVGGGESYAAIGTLSVIGGGFNNLAQCQDGFLGDGEKNQLRGQLAALGGGNKFNIVTKSSVGSCLGGGFKNIVKGPGNYVDGGKKNFSQTQGRIEFIDRT